MRPTLSRIEIFPIKSLPGVSVERAKVLSSGALEHDRRFALVDASGCIVNAKRTALIHGISADFNLTEMTVILARYSSPSGSAGFSLISERPRVEEWFSDYLGERITVVEHPDGGFPDDSEASGVTIVSEASLQAISGWFDDIPLDEIRRRFRTNLEVRNTKAFWEDRLYAHPGAGRRFRVGEAEFAGTQPCQRCAVPPRDSKTGEVNSSFAADFAKRREDSLPDWADLGRFDHYYRLATNTVLLSGIGEVIEVGQNVETG